MCRGQYRLKARESGRTLEGFVFGLVGWSGDWQTEKPGRTNLVRVGGTGVGEVGAAAGGEQGAGP